jgi:hypothetical protein
VAWLAAEARTCHTSRSWYALSFEFVKEHHFLLMGKESIQGVGYTHFYLSLTSLKIN